MITVLIFLLVFVLALVVLVLCFESALYRTKQQLRKKHEALSALHTKALEPREVYFAQDGKPIEISIDLGEAYAESALCEQVEDALR